MTDAEIMEYVLAMIDADISMEEFEDYIYGEIGEDPARLRAIVEAMLKFAEALAEAYLAEARRRRKA